MRSTTLAHPRLQTRTRHVHANETKVNKKYIYSVYALKSTRARGTPPARPLRRGFPREREAGKPRVLRVSILLYLLLKYNPLINISLAYFRG